MTEKPRRAINLPLAAALVAIAAAAGFGAAQWTGTKKAPVVAAVASSTPAAAVEPVQEVNIPGEYLKAAGIAVEAVAAGGLRSEILAPGSVAAQLFDRSGREPVRRSVKTGVPAYSPGLDRASAIAYDTGCGRCRFLGWLRQGIRGRT